LTAEHFILRVRHIAISFPFPRYCIIYFVTGAYHRDAAARSKLEDLFWRYCYCKWWSGGSWIIRTESLFHVSPELEDTQVSYVKTGQIAQTMFQKLVNTEWL